MRRITPGDLVVTLVPRSRLLGYNLGLVISVDPDEERHFRVSVCWTRRREVIVFDSHPIDVLVRVTE